MTVHVLAPVEPCCGWCGASLAGRRKGTRYCGVTCRTNDAKRRAALKAFERPHPSGLQVSFHKAVRVLAEHLAQQLPEAWAFSTAHEVLARALPDRQRERLEAMEMRLP